MQDEKYIEDTPAEFSRNFEMQGCEPYVAAASASPASYSTFVFGTLKTEHEKERCTIDRAAIEIVDPGVGTERGRGPSTPPSRANTLSSGAAAASAQVDVGGEGAFTVDVDDVNGMDEPDDGEGVLDSIGMEIFGDFGIGTNNAMEDELTMAALDPMEIDALLASSDTTAATVGDGSAYPRGGNTLYSCRDREAVSGGENGAGEAPIPPGWADVLAGDLEQGSSSLPFAGVAAAADDDVAAEFHGSVTPERQPPRNLGESGGATPTGAAAGAGNNDRCIESLSESVAARSSEGVADVSSKRRNDGGRTGASEKRRKEGEVSRGGLTSTVAAGVMGALCLAGVVMNSGTPVRASIFFRIFFLFHEYF